MKNRHTEEQIFGFLREAGSGLALTDLCLRHDCSKTSNYLCQNKFGGTSVSDVKRLKELETENGRLKRLLADALIESEITKEALRKSGERTWTARAGATHDHLRLE